MIDLFAPTRSWTDSALHIDRRVAPTAHCTAQVLDIIERCKAKKKQQEEEELMALHGSFSVPVVGELAQRQRLAHCAVWTKLETKFLIACK
jgi:hypothetical protein